MGANNAIVVDIEFGGEPPHAVPVQEERLGVFPAGPGSVGYPGMYALWIACRNDRHFLSDIGQTRSDISQHICPVPNAHAAGICSVLEPRISSSPNLRPVSRYIDIKHNRPTSRSNLVAFAATDDN